MKKLGIFALLLSVIMAAGCSKDDTDSEQTFTEKFDPLFAQELEKRGYIADAKNITPEEVKDITELDVSGEERNDETDKYEGKLTSLRGIEFFESLTILECYGNQLTTLDVSKNTRLTELECDENQLTTLDVSKNTALTALWCGYNPGNGSVFLVTAWFDNNSIPHSEEFTTGSWEYNGKTVRIDYRKAE